MQWHCGNIEVCLEDPLIWLLTQQCILIPCNKNNVFCCLAQCIICGHCYWLTQFAGYILLKPWMSVVLQFLESSFYPLKLRETKLDWILYIIKGLAKAEEDWHNYCYCVLWRIYTSTTLYNYYCMYICSVIVNFLYFRTGFARYLSTVTLE